MKGIEPDYEIKDIGELYPELDAEQRAEADYYLTRYVEIVRRIYERMNGLTGKDEASSF